MTTFKMYTRATADVVTPSDENVDSATWAFKTIDYAHHEIHGGDHYNVRRYKDQTIDHVYDIQITTPNTTKWSHFTYEFETENETLWHFYRNPTIVLAGTAVTPVNSDHNSTNTAALVVKLITNTTLADANLDTTVAAATLIAEGISGSGKKESGIASSRDEAILKQNEDYCLRFIATAAGYVNFHLDWYEHTNKE